MTAYSITWDGLVAVEPTREEVRAHARALAIAYNDPRNAPLLGHTTLLSEADVLDVYTTMWEHGARPFLLLEGGQLAGDGDLRGLASDRAEFAFLIASPDAQGKGLGTRFATMIHAFGFQTLGLAEIHASVVPHNVASRRVFEKLGYREVPASDYGDEGDVVLAVERTRFLEIAGAALPAIRIEVR